MLNVIIVDDEAPIREWIDFCLRKSAHSIETRLCKNGEEALSVFQKESPDLVITDIEMPVMNGLELAGKIREIDPQIPIVILTSHSDFGYARSAMKHGAVEYILKSEISGEMLGDLIDKQLSKIRDVNRGDDKPLKQFRRNRFIMGILSNTHADMPTEKEFAAHYVPLKNKPLCAMAIRISDGMYDASDQKDLFESSLTQLYLENITGFLCNDGIYVFLMNIKDDSMSLLYRLNSLHEIAKDFCSRHKCTIGVSFPFDGGYSDIRKAVKQAKEQCSLAFYDEDARVFQNTGAMTESAKKKEEIKIALAEIIEQISDGMIRDYAVRLGAFFDMVTQAQIADVPFVKECVSSLITAILQTNSTQSSLTIDLELFEKGVGETCSLRELRNLAIKQLEVMPTTSYLTGVPLSKNVAEAKRYMHEHYSEGISLNDVAAKVGLNPEYLSRLFKSEIGVGYTEYLTDLRLRQAEKLLKKTGLRVHEVAEAVGYPNLSYFSTLFKKRYGVNPFDFKSL